MRRLTFYMGFWAMGLLLTGCPLLNPFLEAPESDFEGAPTYGEAPLTVLFTDLSTAGTTNIEAWQWDFGDGTTSTLRSPSHIYAAPGVYTVSLTVTTSVGTDTNLRSAYIEVVEEPEADFTAAPLTGGAPLAVSFTDTSTPGSSPITAWEWNFGDRSPIGTDQNPNHTYTAPGRYTVSLAVTTTAGSDKETKSSFVEVVAAPEANFTSDFRPGVAPLQVNFTDTSTTGPGSVLSWAWDFGDGGLAVEQNPSYTFAAPGVYTVTLTVETVGGEDQEIKADYIQVDQAPVAAFTGEPVTGPAPLSVAFTDESDPGTQAITRRSWNFGDGGLLSSLVNPVRVYNVPGTYDVSLRVTTPAGSNTLLKPAYITVTAVEEEGGAVVKSVMPAEEVLSADLSTIATDPSGVVWAIGTAKSPVILRLDPSGRPTWGVALAHDGGLGLSAVHAPGDGTVYVAGTLENSAWVARVDASGELIWEYRDDDPSDSFGAGLTSGPDGSIILGLLRADTSGGFELHLITLNEDGYVLDSSFALASPGEGSSVALTSSGDSAVLALVAEADGSSTVSLVTPGWGSGAAVGMRYSAPRGLPVAISKAGDDPGFFCAVANGDSSAVFHLDEGVVKHLLNIPTRLIAILATSDGTHVTWLSHDRDSNCWRIERELLRE